MSENISDGGKEIDFVARDGDELAYYQVAQTVMDPATLERELSAFAAMRDNYPKRLLTLDRFGAGASHRGIRQMNLVDWLLDGDSR